MTTPRRVLERMAGDDPIAHALVPVRAEPPGPTSAGRPFLAPRAWELFRDGVPHLFGFGERVLHAVARLTEEVPSSPDLSPQTKQWVKDGAAVIRQVILTAVIT